MAVTHGHGNPAWTRDETILALDLYFDCEGQIPSSSDDRVKELSELLRAFPHHSHAARKESFRNPDGVAFKLQNIRSVATGKGLKNVSKMDRAVWDELGNDPKETKRLASLIRSGIKIVEEDQEDSGSADEVFSEGRVVTESHVRRERNSKIRKKLLEQRKKGPGLSCDICNYSPNDVPEELMDALFEAHHVVPLSAAPERKTKLKDMALLCANCHRLIHRAIAVSGEWITPDEAKQLIHNK